MMPKLLAQRSMIRMARLCVANLSPSLPKIPRPLRHVPRPEIPIVHVFFAFAEGVILDLTFIYRVAVFYHFIE